MSLIEELKRRNVFRVGIAYAVISWLLLQVADVVINNIGAPDWVFRTILLVLALGFPVAIFFAWAFELTPEGLKKEAEVDRTQSITPSTGRKLDFFIIGVMAIAIGYFAWDKFLPELAETGPIAEIGERPQSPAAIKSQEKRILDEQPASKAPPERSIAVLPFADMSPEGDQEYLSDGIAEELLNLLVQIPELQVAARTSSFSFKGKDTKIADVARELHVAHVLEGSVRKAGERVRITAQLIKADDGYHLWSETFDRTLDDVFAIQDEISAAVVEALKLQLLGDAPKAVEVDPAAYSLYLQGRYFMEQRSQPGWERAAAAFQQALEIDPEYATAWAALSNVVGRQAGQAYIELNEGTAKAREAALMALQLDPNLAEGHAAMGAIQMTYDWDWENAEKSLQTAIDLAPGDSRFLAQLGLLKRYQGRLEESIELNRSAVELDPLVLSGYHQLGLALFWAGQLEEALGIYDRLLVLNPNFGVAHLSRSRILLMLNQPEEAMVAAEAETDPFWHDYGVLVNLFAQGASEEAQAQMDAFVEQNHDDAAYQIAQIYGFTGDADLVFEWLELAYVQRDGGLPEVLSDPFLVKYSDDPRWTQMLQKMGLYEAWLRSKV